MALRLINTYTDRFFLYENHNCFKFTIIFKYEKFSIALRWIFYGKYVVIGYFDFKFLKSSKINPICVYGHLSSS